MGKKKEYKSDPRVLGRHRGYLDGAIKHQKEGKEKLIFFFWFFAMMSNFRGCFELDFGLSLERVLYHVYGRYVVSIRAGL